MGKTEEHILKQMNFNFYKPTDDYKSLSVVEDYLDTCSKKLNTIYLMRRDGNKKRFTFTLKGIVGRGSFGIVSKIQEKGSTDDLALKVVLIDPKYRFRELEILQRLSHPNIIDLIGHYKVNTSNTAELKAEKSPCICMITPYIRYTMHDLIKSRLVHIDKLKELYKQALFALRYMHSINICHRDIKPLNILIDGNDKLYISDLGSAKELKENEQNVSYICSRYYRAPECCLGHLNYGLSIDIWSLGIVFAEFACGDLLFASESNQNQIIEMRKILFMDKKDCDFFDLPIITNVPGIYSFLNKKEIDLELTKILSNSIVMNPKKRATADELLHMRYFLPYH